ncbi:hypothetical protein [Amycolatopsis sp. FDAARGOS 1241]|uniref:hypothetical protein n=1 Tax=Amycolatopsis sp. FDAARGOS 1241 TaxID=2778070 RepID=UPI0019503677|nr:hypothetical protein I6J71_11870 [Amycolatopsis sp. FDAARGOS 1241]
MHHFDLRATLGDGSTTTSTPATATEWVGTICGTASRRSGLERAMVLLPWNLYWEYGDPEILERCVPRRAHLHRPAPGSGRRRPVAPPQPG